MLVQFILKNYLSFRDEQVISFVAASGLREKKEQLTDNTVEVRNELELVKSAVVYGANASGKSNLLRAVGFFVDNLTLNPPTGQPVSSFSPFLLDQHSANEPMLMEAVFEVGGVLYRYGFEIQQQTVIAEWLFVRRKQESYVFERKGNKFRINRPYRKLHELESNGMVAPTVLLLKLGALFNDESCLAVQQWAKGVQNIQDTDDYQFQEYTIKYLEEPATKQRILELLRYADLGIEDIELVPLDLDTAIRIMPHQFYGGPEVQPTKPTASSEQLPQGSFRMPTSLQPSTTYSIRTIRESWDQETGTFKSVSMPLSTFESQGTQKFFNLIGLILWHLDHGGLLVADELDTKLHPLLTQRIVQLFNSPVTNSGNAQFLFATHDTNLLSARLFRRDQIWFTEKDIKGATQLYALTDYKPGKTVRNDEQLEKNYIAGKYGGIPYLGNFDVLFEKSAGGPALVDE